MKERLLEHWVLVGNRLCGRIYNDDRFPDGEIIHTTPVMGFDEVFMTAKTKTGTLYNLGEVDPDQIDALKHLLWKPSDFAC